MGFPGYIYFWKKVGKEKFSNCVGSKFPDILFFSFQASILDVVKKYFPSENIILRIKSYATLEEAKQNVRKRIISHGEVSTFYQPGKLLM